MVDVIEITINEFKEEIYKVAEISYAEIHSADKDFLN